MLSLLVIALTLGVCDAFISSTKLWAGKSTRAESMQRLQAFNRAKEFDNFDPQSPVLSKNRLDEPWVEQRVRPRRNRKSETIRSMFRENIVTPSDFIYPLFIHDEASIVEIASMPGCMRHSLDSMMKEDQDAPSSDGPGPTTNTENGVGDTVGGGSSGSASSTVGSSSSNTTGAVGDTSTASVYTVHQVSNYTLPKDFTLSDLLPDYDKENDSLLPNSQDSDHHTTIPMNTTCKASNSDIQTCNLSLQLPVVEGTTNTHLHDPSSVEEWIVHHFEFHGGHFEGWRSIVSGELEGAAKFDDGCRREGRFVNMLMHGEGEIVYADGATLQGVFKNGEPWDATGLYEGPDMGVYQGVWESGQFRRGWRKLAGNYEDGDFCDGVLYRGRVTLAFTDGSVYKGEWFNGFKHGNGSYTDPRGYTIEGMFHMDVFRCGSGQKLNSSGALYTGHWQEYKYHGQGEVVCPSGEKFGGEFRAGMLYNGSGEVPMSSGEVYSGTWVCGRMEGKGSVKTKKGILCEGEFKNGAKHGLFTMTTPTGCVKYGYFDNNNRVGEFSCTPLSSPTPNTNIDTTTDSTTTTNHYVTPDRSTNANIDTTTDSTTTTNHDTTTTNVNSSITQYNTDFGDNYSWEEPMCGPPSHSNAEHSGVTIPTNECAIPMSVLRRVLECGRELPAVCDVQPPSGLVRGTYTPGNSTSTPAEPTTPQTRSTTTSRKKGTPLLEALTHRLGISVPTEDYTTSSTTTTSPSTPTTTIPKPVYEGGWLHGQYHGHGTLTLPNLATLIGIFKSGELHTGEISIQLENGVVLVLLWVGGEWNHYEYMLNLDNSVWKGKFIVSDVNIKPYAGYGSVYCNDGCISTGNWHGGKLEGLGYMLSGSIVRSGVFSNGEVVAMERHMAHNTGGVVPPTRNLTYKLKRTTCIDRNEESRVLISISSSTLHSAPCSERFFPTPTLCHKAERLLYEYLPKMTCIAKFTLYRVYLCQIAYESMIVY